MSSKIMPSEHPVLQIEAFYLAGTTPFICGANGHITGHCLDTIEQEFIENEKDYFDKDGRYLFEANYNEEQRGDMGRVEVGAYWDLNFVHYVGLPEENVSVI